MKKNYILIFFVLLFFSILILFALLFVSIISGKQEKVEDNVQTVNALHNGKTVQIITQNGKKYGVFYQVKINNHKYIIYQSQNKCGLTHDPDCDCTLSEPSKYTIQLDKSDKINRKNKYNYRKNKYNYRKNRF